MITLEKGIVHTRNHLDLIISASNYYCFQKTYADLRIESLVVQGRFPGCGRFPGYERPSIKSCRNSCRNPGHEDFPE